MPHDKLTSPINYLEPKDFETTEKHGFYDVANKKIKQGFCLIYSSDPSCKQILPVYQKFANENIKNKKKNIDCYAIKIDSDDWKGKDSNAQNYIVKRVSKTEKYPCFILIDKQGSLKTGRVDMYGLNITDRTAEGLQKIKKELTGDNKVFRP